MNVSNRAAEGRGPSLGRQNSTTTNTSNTSNTSNITAGSNYITSGLQDKRKRMPERRLATLATAARTTHRQHTSWQYKYH